MYIFLNLCFINDFKHTYVYRVDNLYNIYNLVVYKDSLAFVSGYDYGLTEINLKVQTKKNFTINDGMPTQLVYDLRIDPASNLWMSSDYGLIRYSIQKKQFKNFFSPLPSHSTYSLLHPPSLSPFSIPISLPLFGKS